MPSSVEIVGNKYLEILLNRSLRNYFRQGLTYDEITKMLLSNINITISLRALSNFLLILRSSKSLVVNGESPNDQNNSPKYSLIYRKSFKANFEIGISSGEPL